ncbi:MAG TPA: DUF547 domain-containing protein [Saprospiraceae bacterium]|nr:DUF547 domain-containing protein [Saprospiraceae bacterium]HMP25092.1 DUF547 domain-containing protein [Saprospiraceae bacterium]
MKNHVLVFATSSLLLFANACAPSSPQTPTDSAPATPVALTPETTPQKPAPEVPQTETQPAPTPPQATPKTNAPRPKPLTETTPIVEPVVAEESSEKVAKPDHAAWNDLLKKYVSTDGKVNYKGFKQDMPALEAYLNELTSHPIQSDWSRTEKMAYWINAYNAFTIKLILDNYPLKSIIALDNGKTWDVKRVQLGDKTYSLNGIENDILRPQYKDARIHFAVNCAAKSCPPLLNRAWTGDNLSKYLDQQAKAFINNSKYNKISADAVQISKIFEWYAADFGDIIAYLNKYSNVKINPSATVTYIEYDWALNE